jgi:hypothetical protein
MLCINPIYTGDPLNQRRTTKKNLYILDVGRADNLIKQNSPLIFETSCEHI